MNKKNGKAKLGTHPNSLANLAKGNPPWKAGDPSPNPAGRPRDPILIVKERLFKIFTEPHWAKNAKSEETIVLILKHAVDSYIKETDSLKKQGWYNLLVGGSASARKESEQPNNTGINAQNVIILPALRPVELPKPQKPDEIDHEIIE